MNKLHVALSPLTNTIYAGSVLKDGRTWGANKTDVTNAAICAVVDHVVAFNRATGDDLILSKDGKPVIKLMVIHIGSELL